MLKLLTTLPSRLLLASLLLLLACTRHEADPTDYYLAYASYRPLFMTRATLESAVAALPPQALHHPGKIYLSGDYLFINERYEGIHIIDNRDPAHPQPVSFLRIPGNVDLATQGTVLYADNGPDLVAIDISDPAHARLLGRTRSAFRELPMPEAGVLEEACQPINRPVDVVVVGWRKLAPGEAVPVKVASGSSRATGLASYSAASNASPASLGESGKAGSTARFGILGQMLYTVDEQSMHLFSLQNPTAPTVGPVVQLGFGIETIFPQDHYLFLGSQTGMFIYDAAVPTAPKLVGVISHARSCDPVVVDGRFAYVTLRSTAEGSNGSATSTMRSMFVCGGITQTNELDVVDISNPAQPHQVRAYPMSGPLGLGAENGRLYVCDDGLKIFDTTKAPELTQVQQFATSVTDVIPNGDYLLAVGTNGLYQYALGATVRQVSVLPIAAD